MLRLETSKFSIVCFIRNEYRIWPFYMEAIKSFRESEQDLCFLSLQISCIRFGICFGYCSIKEIMFRSNYSSEDLFIKHNKGSFRILDCLY